MCGIVGYVGKEQAAPILLEGLSKLEYRGYDSAGVCVFDNGILKVAKAKGRLQSLVELTDGGKALNGVVGIGHTRCPLQYSCLENCMDGGDWQATVHGVAKSDMTEQLSFFTKVILDWMLQNT